MLELSETGEVTATRILTLGERLRHPLVAAGARRGQIWIHDDKSNIRTRHNSTMPWLIAIDIYLYNVDTDTVIQALHLKEPIHRGTSWGIVGLDTGELIRSTCNEDSYCVLQLYQPDLTTPPQNLKITGHLRVLTAYGNHFLVLDEPSNTILILNGSGELVYTVDDLNGKHAGIWMKIQDVAVWQNNLVVLSSDGGVMILRMG